LRRCTVAAARLQRVVVCAFQYLDPDLVSVQMAAFAINLAVDGLPPAVSIHLAVFAATLAPRPYPRY
jgi:hypothetical protein